MLRERISILSSRTMRQATHHMERADRRADRRCGPGSAKRSIDALTATVHNQRGVTHHARQLMSRRIHARESLQLVGAMWTLFHSPRLTSADLSCLTDSGGSLPVEALRAIGAAIRLGAPALVWVKLHAFAIPIHQLRRVCPSRPGADLARGAPGEVCDFRSLGVAPVDLVLMCHACGDMAHVSELDLSRNALGDAGLLALANELDGAEPLVGTASAHVPALSPQRATPARLLPNLRVLGLNSCGLSDQSLTRFFGAVRRRTLLPLLEHLSLVDNQMGNAALGEFAQAVDKGSFTKLLHLNLGSNDVADEGCAHLALAFEHGGLASLIHLSLARNQVADGGLESLAHSLQATTCRARIEYLGLGDNLFGDAGVLALTDAIRHGRGLCKLAGLWLADNDGVADTGVVALASALERSPMQNLYLHNTSMHRAGWQAMIMSLPFYPEIKLLVLGRVVTSMHRMIDWTLQSIRERHRREISVCYLELSEGGRPPPTPKRQRGKKAPPSPLGTHHHRSAHASHATSFMGGIVHPGTMAM